MASIKISDEEKAFFIMLADRYLQGGKYVHLREFPVSANADQSVAMNLGLRYVNLGILRPFTESQFEIPDKIVEIAHQLKNPPPKDYWADISTWFRSKPWSIPVFFVLIALPLLVQWVQMIQYLLNWIIKN